MLKIRYPKAVNQLYQLHQEYLAVFKLDDNPAIQAKYSRIRALLNIAALPGNLSTLLTASFADLANWSFLCQAAPPRIKTLVAQFFNYENHQVKIARFFMSKRKVINLITCYYCNIDHINIFKDLGDFYNGTDLAKRGTKEDLMKILDIGEATADHIIGLRGTFNRLEELPGISNGVKDNIDQFVLNDVHNHFTIDHVLHKSLHPLVALSLHNFVPSCSSCNEKFKGQKVLVRSTAEIALSPTFPDFNFDRDVKFKIYFVPGVADITSIKTENDFLLDFKIDNFEPEYLHYIKVFKLKGRYVFHKREVLKLIEKVKDYSESEIEEIAGIVGRTPAKIRADIFGYELFEGETEDRSFTKLRRDISNDIGIVGVVKT